LPVVLFFRNGVKYPNQKYFAFPETQISRMVQPIPARSEGRFAIVTNVGPECGGRLTLTRFKARTNE
jgi:hypothetical protein